MSNPEKRHSLTVLAEDLREECARAPIRCAGGDLSQAIRLPACELLQQVIHGLPEAIALLDRDFRYIAVNEAYRRAFHATHSRQVGRGVSFLDAVAHDPAQRDRAAALWARAFAGETFTVTEHFGDERRGRKSYFEISYSPIRDAAGNVVAAMDCCRDVTERLVSEAALLNSNVELERRVAERTAALLESESQLRLTLESAKLGIWSVDGGTNRMQWSGRACAVFGLSPRPDVGLQRWLDLVHPGDRARVSWLLDHALAPGAGPFRDEFRCVWPDGEVRWVVARGETHLLPGHPAGFRTLGTFTDVTDRKRHEEEIRRGEEERQRLEENLHHATKMEAIGQLAGGIAHDFNNLLAVILAGVEELKSRPIVPGPDGEIFDEIDAAATRGRELTTRLLALARRQPIAPRLLDVNDLVRDGERLLRRVLPSTIEIVTDLDGAPCSVVGDRGQLDQLILNLAVNARDAMPGGGELRIATVTVEADPANVARHPWIRPGRFVRLSIEDTGVGMSQEVKQRMFEPFFTTKPVGRGTGLGLAIVYGIVKQNEGYLVVESEPGKGTRFDVFLPLAAPTAPGAAGRAA